MPTDLERKALDLERSMDPKERTEREEAANAYSKEDEAHFVEYGTACFQESDQATEDIRKEYDRTWEAYSLERAAEKEDWQCDIITPTPFNLVQHAKSIVRRALVDRPDYFKIDGVGKEDEFLADLYKKIYSFHANENHANFPLRFSQAAEMAFVTGQSMEIIPRWTRQINGTDGLELTLRPPWHISRDPSCEPLNPWSGMYWIHTEYLDRWELVEMEREGIYQNIAGAFSAGEEEDRKRKDEDKKRYIMSRSRYRKSLLSHEFWGIVLDKDGNLLLPNATFTWGGRSLIRKVRPNPYPVIRWPGVGFSALPDLMRFEGRSILTGVLSLWEFYDNLLNAYGDDLNWAVNRGFEIDPTLLADRGADTEMYPGRVFIKSSGSPAGVPAVREILSGSTRTGEVLSTLNHFDQLIQNGAFLPHFLTGIPGSRSKITKGEFEGKREDSLGLFDSIGKDLEMGAVWTIRAILDVITIHWTDAAKPNMAQVFGEQFLEFARSLSLSMPEERAKALRFNADITVSGISNLLKQNDTLQRLNALMQRVETRPEIWGPYVKPYNMIKTQTDILGLSGEGLVKTEDELAEDQAKLMADQQKQNQRTSLVNESLQRAGLKTDEGQQAGNKPAPKQRGQ